MREFKPQWNVLVEKYSCCVIISFSACSHKKSILAKLNDTELIDSFIFQTLILTEKKTIVD